MANIVTPEEAKDKWCPLARVQGEVAAYNRLDSDNKSRATRCISTDCMAWKRYCRDTHDERGFCGAFGVG